jgi:hypothetical protein
MPSAKCFVTKDDGSSTQSIPLTSYLATAFALTAVGAYGRQCAPTEDVTVLAKYIPNISVNKVRFDFGKIRVKLSCDRKEMDGMYAVSRVVFCCHRRLFVTLPGRVGLGPRAMQLRDVVALLRGGHTPCILRLDEEKFRLIGSAYVHGIMNGEAVHIQIASCNLREAVFPVR